MKARNTSWMGKKCRRCDKPAEAGVTTFHTGKFAYQRKYRTNYCMSCFKRKYKRCEE